MREPRRRYRWRGSRFKAGRSLKALMRRVGAASPDGFGAARAAHDRGLREALARRGMDEVDAGVGCGAELNRAPKRKHLGELAVHVMQVPSFGRGRGRRTLEVLSVGLLTRPGASA
jgi:hypothetical protein